jgi:hypothetical protein
MVANAHRWLMQRQASKDLETSLPTDVGRNRQVVLYGFEEQQQITTLELDAIERLLGEELSLLLNS